MSIEKSLRATTSIAAIVAATAVIPGAEAGDWNNGAHGLKGSYASKITAVPAPAPIPEYEAKYYIGVVGTYTAASSGTLSQEGIEIEAKSISDTANYLNAGFTIGRYITPSIRAELAFDFRPLRSLTTRNTQYLDFQVDSETDTGHIYLVDREDISEYQYQTGMINIYHDFKNNTRFTPFLGAGIGAVLYTFKRDSSESGTCVQSFQRGDDTGTWVGETVNGQAVCTNAPARETSPNNDTSNSWGFALSGTAGVAIDVSDSMKFDIAYRALYTSGSVELSDDSDSTLKIEDRLDHELRLGLRWDIN